MINDGEGLCCDDSNPGIVALDQQGQRGQCGVRSILEECHGQRIGGGDAVEQGWRNSIGPANEYES